MSKPTPKALVLRAAGVNCDMETAFALESAGFATERVHIFRVMENPQMLRDVQFIVLPGGFSYGDDVAAGKILANQMLHRLADAFNEFVQADKLMLGICNGFQVMIKSGLLPWGNVSPAQAHKDATLGWNDSGMFIDKWVDLSCDSDKCVFLPKGEVLSLPIAHGEGKFIPAEPAVLDKLKNAGQVALRYSGKNPNGSTDDIAGICDPSGRILGLMPHPERFVNVTQHPQWTRKKPDRADGMVLFNRAFEYFA